MSKEDFERIVNFIQGYYNRKLDKNELISLKNELKSVEQFEKIKKRLINEIDYFSVAKLHKLFNDNQEHNTSTINWNSSYWFDNDREICDREGIPYYDITKGIDVTLEPYKV